MPERAIRAMRAIEKAPSAVAGSTSDASPSRPAAGNHPSQTAKTRMSRSPSQYTGMACPSSTPTEQTASRSELRRSAARMPAGTATTRASARPGRRQLERRGQRLADQGEGGHLVLEGEPEVSADGAGEKAQVLDPERIVEPQQRAELPDILLAGFERQEQPRRITGEVQEPEDDHRDAEEDQHALQEPAQDVGEHVRSLPSPSPLPPARTG